MKNEKILSKLTDFRNFLYITWKHLNLPQPTKIQYDIADYIANGDSRIIISAFRGINASVIGLLIAALYDPIILTSLQSYYDFALILISFIILFFIKIPQWAAVIFISFCGWIITLVI